jgi:hypothetical protein
MARGLPISSSIGFLLIRKHPKLEQTDLRIAVNWKMLALQSGIEGG